MKSPATPTKAVIDSVTVHIPDQLPKQFYLKVPSTYGGWVACWNLGSARDAKAELDWESSLSLGTEGLVLNSDASSSGSLWKYPAIPGAKVRFRFRRVRVLGYDYEKSQPLEYLRDEETEHYQWLWALNALIKGGGTNSSTARFFEQALFPEYTNDFSAEDCAGFCKQFFEKLERFVYAHGVLTDITAVMNSGTEMLFKGMNKDRPAEAAARRVRKRVEEMFTTNLVLTVCRPMTRGMGEAFLESLSPRMLRWVSSRKA